MNEKKSVVWALFVTAALIFALLPGFLLGALLFVWRLTDDERLSWEVAAGQTHGHLQLFGWAGMMVLGVGLHFLPRLRGVPPVNTRIASIALTLLTTGLTLRSFCQPLVASTEPSGFARAGFALSGVLEFAGVLIALSAIVLCLSQPTPKRRSDGFRQMMPFLIVAVVSYLLAMLVNMLGVIAAVRDSRAIVTDWSSSTVLLGFYGFLVPISIGMSTRLFPLYIQTFAARTRILALALTGLELGLLVRIWGVEQDTPDLAAVGKLLQGIALFTMIAAIRIFDSRRQLPRRQVRPLGDPIQLHIIAAYAWLAVVSVVLAFSALNHFFSNPRYVPDDAEFHALGAGFVTLLILGVGAHLLPGFAKHKIRNWHLAWTTLILANTAVILRLIPELADETSAQFDDLSGTLAGLVGATAIIVFAWNIRIGRTWFQPKS